MSCIIHPLPQNRNHPGPPTKKPPPGLAGEGCAVPWHRLCVVLVQEGDDLAPGAVQAGAEGGGAGARGDVVPHCPQHGAVEVVPFVHVRKADGHLGLTLQGRFCWDAAQKSAYPFPQNPRLLLWILYQLFQDLQGLFPNLMRARRGKGPPQGTARSAFLQKAYSWVFFRFSPMLNSRLRAMPKMAAPAMQGTCRPKKGMLPPN